MVTIAPTGAKAIQHRLEQSGAAAADDRLPQVCSEPDILLAVAEDLPLGVLQLVDPTNSTVRQVASDLRSGGPDSHAVVVAAAAPFRPSLLLGATPQAVLYAAYEYATRLLGVTFQIDGDIIL